MSRLKSSSLSSVEIDMEDDSSSLAGTSNAANELEQYLLEQKRSQNNNVLGYISNVGSSIGKYLPKRTGTGSIEDDIAVRFGNLFRSGSSNNGDGSGVSNAASSSTSSCCTLSRKERIIAFFVLLGMGLLFFTLSSLYIPVLLFAARKFSIFFTLGSVFTFASFSMLWGFTSFVKHLMTPERVPFTVMYFGSLFATLYFAVGLKSTIFTIVGIILQVISLISFLVSYLPGGVAGMKYLTSFVTSSMGRSLPI
ncbi:unnamed protein product [Orchesella dallaii]|uniref:Vesicle transport protein n=1 Tax=Orchesella dallaii TaxID=48710 RepID=A0ABP1QV36_9HEXA